MPKSETSRRLFLNTKLLEMKKVIVFLLLLCCKYAAWSQGNSDGTAVLTIKFSGVFMGECGSSNDCSHEPVAGLVLGNLIDRNGNEIPSTQGNKIYFRSAEHTLPCPNYHSPELNISGIPRADNVNTVKNYYVTWQGLLNGNYTLQVDFNLGNPHKDNGFASTGHHWLRHGEERIELDFNLKDVINRSQLLIGPFQTQSDRCHEYYLQFFLQTQ